MRIYRRGDRELHVSDGRIWIMLMRPQVGGGDYVKDNLFIDLPWRRAERFDPVVWWRRRFPRRWTQAEVDDVRRRGREIAERLKPFVEEPPDKPPYQ